MNGEGDAPVTPCVPEGLADAYEQLRPAATGAGRDANVHGLGTLIRKGMAAWMRACAAVTPAAGPPLSPVSGSAQMLSAVQRDVVDVLAAMALTITPEVTT